MKKKASVKDARQRVPVELKRTLLMAACICQRCYPNYQLFCQVSGFADPLQYRNILNVVWEWLLVDGAKINFELQAEKLEPLTPDAEQFDMFGVYPAIDACVALNSGLNAVLEGEGESYLRELLALSRNALQGFLDMQNIESQDSPLVEANEYLLNTVLSLTDVEIKSPAAIKELRRLAANQGVSNLGITADE